MTPRFPTPARAHDRRRALFAEVIARAKPGTVTLTIPDVRRDLFYTDDGWRIRERGLIAQRHLTCWSCGNRIYIKGRPKEGVHPCHTKLDRQRECGASVYLLSVRPGWLWFMDVAAHEVALIDLMYHDEILEWFEVEHQRIRKPARAQLGTIVRAG